MYMWNPTPADAWRRIFARSHGGHQFSEEATWNFRHSYHVISPHNPFGSCLWIITTIWRSRQPIGKEVLGDAILPLGNRPTVAGSQIDREILLIGLMEITIGSRMQDMMSIIPICFLLRKFRKT